MESDTRIGRGQVSFEVFRVPRIYTCMVCRWASQQAKARELGDVVDFVRDLNIEDHKEHLVE